MKRHHFVLAMIIALAIANGVTSPKLMMVFALQGIWYPSLFPAHLQLMFVLSAAILALLYFMVSGVPAALYEKLRGQEHADVTSRLIWLATLALLSWPSFAPFLFQG
jgi:hypothetical protein